MRRKKKKASEFATVQIPNPKSHLVKLSLTWGGGGGPQRGRAEVSQARKHGMPSATGGARQLRLCCL